MRFRRIEFIAIALTFAFVCFLGGYFAGSRGSVSIVAVEPQHGETQQLSSRDMADTTSYPMSTMPEALPSATSNTASETPQPLTGANEDNRAIAAPDTKPSPAAPAETELVGAPRGGDGRININNASRSELMDLPGIGDVLSGRIIDYRNQHGAFSSIDDIRRVSGIGDKKFEAIKDLITVN